MTSKGRPSDYYIALKALSVARHLNRSEALVTGALLGHYNMKTGQCDPSVQRLATMLGMARSKVLQATSTLCSSGGKHLFDKKSHGGKSHRASYSPKWESFAAILDDWETRMVSPDGPQKRALNIPPNEDVDGPQKGDTNSLKELFEGTLGAREDKTLAPAIDRSKGLGRVGAKPPQQRSMINPIPGSKFAEQPSRASAAIEQAKRRISDQVRGTDIEAWLAATDHSNIYFDAAVKQEIHRRGHGFSWLRNRMTSHRLGATEAAAVKP